MAESQPRYNTDITREHYFKYRIRNDIPSISVFYGSDKELMLKTWHGFQKGTILGVCAASIVATYDQAGFDLSRAVERCFRHGMPWVIAGTAYGLTVSSSANIRKKEGPLNHVFGGIAAGTMFGSWYKSARIGAWSAAAFAGFGGLIKLMVDTDSLPKSYIRRPRIFNYYRTGWFTDRPDPEGNQDGDDTFRSYNPSLK